MASLSGHVIFAEALRVLPWFDLLCPVGPCLAFLRSLSVVPRFVSALFCNPHFCFVLGTGGGQNRAVHGRAQRNAVKQVRPGHDSTGQNKTVQDRT